MDTYDLVRMTAWRAGVEEGLADRIVDAFLRELGESIGRGEVVLLEPFGAFVGPAFRPGAASAPRAAGPPGRRA